METQNKMVAQINAAELPNVRRMVFIRDKPKKTPEAATDPAAEAEAAQEVVDAVEDKYDTLRDKLLMEALMAQAGKADWDRLSEAERQKRLQELRLKERRLRREGKWDELEQLLGDALKNEELLGRLLGDSKSEADARLRERLEARKKERLAAGMTEQEAAAKMAEEEAEAVKEEESRRKNVLKDLDYQLDRVSAPLKMLGLRCFKALLFFRKKKRC